MDDATKTAAVRRYTSRSGFGIQQCKIRDAFVAYMDDSTAKVESKGEQTRKT